MATGRPAEAFTEARRHIDLSPLGKMANNEMPFILYLGHRYDSAIAQYHKALEVFPNEVETSEGLADAYAAAGRDGEAFEAYQQWARAAGYAQPVIEDLTQAYTNGGMKGYWEKRVQIEKIEEEETGDVFPYRMASLYARLNRVDDAVFWLERAYAEHSNRLIFLRVDPVFARLHHEPRFENLARRVGLP
jgi:tetratricopeptide (TPR) repeat protein